MKVEQLIELAQPQSVEGISGEDVQLILQSINGPWSQPMTAQQMMEEVNKRYG